MAQTVTQQLEAALRPFYAAYQARGEDIPDSDLDDEQVKSVHVTLGDIRRARRALAALEALRTSPSWKRSKR